MGYVIVYFVDEELKNNNLKTIIILLFYFYFQGIMEKEGKVKEEIVKISFY